MKFKMLFSSITFLMLHKHVQLVDIGHFYVDIEHFQN